MDAHDILSGDSYVYLAGPYGDGPADGRNARQQALTLVAAALSAEDIPVFSPITHRHALLTVNPVLKPGPHWQETDLLVLKRASCVVAVALPGWEECRDLRVVLDAAEKWGIPVHFMAWNGASRVAADLDALYTRIEEQRAQTTPDGEVIAFTDGSCLKNPNGPGGWAVVLTDGREFSGGDDCTTNNIMEMQAAVEALRLVSPKAAIKVVSDSQYVIKGMTEWLSGWKRRNWTTAAGDPVKNKDLWVTLDRLASERSVSWEWVRGHNGNDLNERADRLANEQAHRRKR